MDKDRVLALAKLARIEMNEAEAEKLSSEFGAILNYVGEVKKVSNSAREEEKDGVHNVFREDGEPHQSGLYTEEILNNAPTREGHYIKVKKIL